MLYLDLTLNDDEDIRKTAEQKIGKPIEFVACCGYGVKPYLNTRLNMADGSKPNYSILKEFLNQFPSVIDTLNMNYVNDLLEFYKYQKIELKE